MERTELNLWNANEVARLLALVENEKRYYQEVLNVAPVPMAVVSPAMAVISVNRAFRTLLAGGRQQVDDVLPKAETESLVRHAIEHNSCQTAELLKVIGRDGRLHNFHASAFPFHESAAEGTHNVLLVLEEIRQTKAPDALSELPSAVWSCEPATGRVAAENEAGRQWGPGPLDAARVAAAASGAAPGDVVEVEYRVERPGDDLWLRDRIHVLSADRLVVETADITAERNLRESKVQSRKAAALSRLAGGLSHEFNNLLTIIYGNADTLLHRTPAVEDRAALEQILGAAERAAAIGDQLRRMARTAPPKPQLFDLNEFLRRNTVGAKLELSEGPQFVSVDASMLSDALRSLAVWAAERVADGGRLTVRTTRRAGPGPAVVWLTLGPMAGLSDDEVERWMEPTGAAQGYDLAAAFLALEHMKTPVALEAMGGRHVFTIGFPVVAETREASMGTILVVEDEEAVRLVVTKLLSQSGFEVLEAASGGAALDIVRNHPDPIDLLLTDVGLGDMQGTDVANQVRERFPEIKVIFMSGQADPVPGRPESGDQFLPKPFRLGALLEMVRKTLGEGA